MPKSKEIKIKFTESKTAYRVINGKHVPGKDRDCQDNTKAFVKLKKLKSKPMGI